MMYRKITAGFELSIMILSMFAFSMMMAPPVEAANTISTPSFCCEETTNGASCINTDQANCDASFQMSPTSCEATSYCKLGTCYDSDEGICMDNTPQNVCEDNGGKWDDRDVSEVPQCQLGCCVLIDEAAFVPLVRCKRLASTFGIDVDYRTDITDEISCIAEAQSQDMGACVNEGGIETDCTFTTRNECNAPDGVVNGSSSGKRFYEGVLCSAEELATSCGKQASTECYNEKVYFFDSCGNRENVFSSNKDASWNNGREADPDEVCARNGGSSDCGNCDYLMGSRCSKYSGILGIGAPSDGDYVCKATSCKDRDGNSRKNGESWCVYDTKIGNGADPVGSRHYKEYCLDGAVKVEACADFRNEVCVHDAMDTSGEFSTAACRVNRWQACTSQTTKGDCDNDDARDCVWFEKVPGINFSAVTANEPTTGFSQPSTAGTAFNQGKTGADLAGATFGTDSSPSDSTTSDDTTQGGTFDVVNIIAPLITGRVIGSGTGQSELRGNLDVIETQTDADADSEDGHCVPNIPPGFNFWDGGDGGSTCSQASANCVVEIVVEKDILGDKKYELSKKSKAEGCAKSVDKKTGKVKFADDWAVKANAVCASMGDCGGYVNFVGKYTDDGYDYRVGGDNKSRRFTPNEINRISLEGRVIAPLTGFATRTLTIGDNKYYRDGADAWFLVVGDNKYPVIKDRDPGYVEIQKYLASEAETSDEGIAGGGAADRNSLLISTGKKTTPLFPQRSAEVITLKTALSEAEVKRGTADKALATSIAEMEKLRSGSIKATETSTRIIKGGWFRDSPAKIQEKIDSNRATITSLGSEIAKIEKDGIPKRNFIRQEIGTYGKDSEQAKAAIAELEKKKATLEEINDELDWEKLGLEGNVAKAGTTVTENTAAIKKLDADIKTQTAAAEKAQKASAEAKAKLTKAEAGLRGFDVTGGVTAEQLKVLNAESLYREGDTLYRTDSEGITAKVTDDELEAAGITDVSKLTLTKDIPKPAGAYSGKVDTVFGKQMNFVGGHLVQGLTWATTVVGFVRMFGPLFGADENDVKAWSAALGAGIMAGKASYALMGNRQVFGDSKGLSKGLGSTKGWSIGIGIAVAWATYNLQYKKIETETITFTCQQWQAPNGQNDCELCNEDGLPCSEYRCKSLGQNCEVVNEGTENEMCVGVNPKDSNPPLITPNDKTLSIGYRYDNIRASAPGPGFEIVAEDGDGCVAAYDPIEFGIKTDEPAQCKIDIVSKPDYESMTSFFGGDNIYQYNHSDRLVLPNAKDLNGTGITINNGNEMTLYARCKDKNGNVNPAEYAIRFCVDDLPDTTAPAVVDTSIENGGCVAAETDGAMVDFYINEPSECKWSTSDQTFERMENNMTCSTQVYQVNAQSTYTCRTNVTGIARDNTNFYIRCKDQPNAPESDRNENRQSYVYSLHGSSELSMKNLMPNSSIFGAVNPSPVELSVETLYGCSNGEAICQYSTTGNDADYITFFDTGAIDGIHTQRQDLFAGTHTYHIKCVDSGGNVAINTTTFNLDIDTNAPVVARVYEEDELLKVVTVRDSECSYTLNNCDFSFEEGTEIPYGNTSVHVSEWNKDQTYYIKCRDEFQNIDAGCSVIVRPSQNFL